VDEEMLLGAAHQEYKSGNYKQALQHCTLVHEKSPQRTDALLLLGAIYYQLRDFDMCIVKNEEAIRIEPQFAECYGNMANALKEKGNIDLAIQYYTVAIEVPSFSGMWIVKYAMCLCNCSRCCLASVCALTTCQHLLLLQLLTVYWTSFSQTNEIVEGLHDHQIVCNGLLTSLIKLVCCKLAVEA
jgi:protein O-GlcNAc transferase